MKGAGSVLRLLRGDPKHIQHKSSKYFFWVSKKTTGLMLLANPLSDELLLRLFDGDYLRATARAADPH